MQVTEQYSKCEDAEITKHLMGDFPGGSVVDSLLPMQRAWVLSLIRELRSHMAHGMAQKKKKKEKSQKASNVLCLVEGLGSRQVVGI